jgi:hypothetical protein
MAAPPCLAALAQNIQSHPPRQAEAPPPCGAFAGDYRSLSAVAPANRDLLFHLIHSRVDLIEKGASCAFFASLEQSCSLLLAITLFQS